MIIYSHRGDSLNAPENTFEAFYYAYLTDADGIETDVRLTKDKIPILIHDKTINRTSNSKLGGKVSKYTYEELLKFDFGLFKSKFYKGTKIVKLEDFLKYFSNKKMKYCIELKEKAGVEEIIQIIKKYNIENITLISFKYDILEIIKKYLPNIKIGWIIYEINNINIKKTIDLNISTLISLSISIKEDDVIECHNNNITLLAWGVNEYDIKRLDQIGVDGIMFDSYIKAMEVLNND